MAKLIEHRGSKGNLSIYAPRYIRDRISGFTKDVDICLTGVVHKNSGKLTHAYFPALGISFGFLEHMAAIMSGKKIRNVGDQDVSAWADRYLPQPEYAPQVVRLFYVAFRHSVNHRGIADGVWIDKSREPKRRITWQVFAGSHRPAFDLLEQPGVLKNDPPWDCPYTHRAHIYPRTLKIDLAKAARKFASEIPNNRDLLSNFKEFALQVYPPP